VPATAVACASVIAEPVTVVAFLNVTIAVTWAKSFRLTHLGEELDGTIPCSATTSFSESTNLLPEAIACSFRGAAPAYQVRVLERVTTDDVVLLPLNGVRGVLSYGSPSKR
jgi:hypothetical protein